MSPQHQSPGANAATNTARTGESGPAPVEPDQHAPGAAAGADPESGITSPPTTGAESGSALPTGEPESGTTAGEPGTSGETQPGAPGTTGESEAPPTAPAAATPAAADSAASTTPQGTGTGDASAKGAAAASEEGATLAAATVATPPAVTSGTGVDGGRPRKPVLAAAAVVGTALIAIPLLLVGSAKDEGPRDSGGPAGAGAGTVLNAEPAPAALDDFVTVRPSASPTKAKPKKSPAPAAVAPVPVAPAPAPAPRKSSPAKKTPPPEPKASPAPEWGTATVSAPSVLQVNQAWTTNRIRMVMQPDGNLVVLNEEGKPIWAAMTFGQNHRAIFQPDGNLVIHNGDDRPIWASRTHDHPGARMILRADAKVVIVDGGAVIWST